MTNTLYRDRSRGMIAGVCAGLADYFGVSAGLMRLIFVLLAVAGGPGVLIYIILWIVLPEQSSITSSRQRTVQDNIQEIGAEARSLGRELQGVFGGKGETATSPSNRLIWLSGLIILMGLVLLADSLHLFGWFQLDRLWPIVLILAGIVLINRALRGK